MSDRPPGVSEADWQEWLAQHSEVVLTPEPLLASGPPPLSDAWMEQNGEPATQADWASLPGDTEEGVPQASWEAIEAARRFGQGR